MTIAEHIAYLNHLVRRGGPDENEWGSVSGWMNELGKAIEQKDFSDEEICRVYDEIGKSFPVTTIQGHTYHKPRKYAGDFELLDKIQTSYITPDVHFANWDRYFHSCKAPRAVRYRIQYLASLLNELMTNRESEISFLNIASGPCRDIFTFFCGHPSANINVDCVDHDPDAIAFSRNLLTDYSDRINFINTNFLKFYFLRKYDLIWSAGLFDYFDDIIFVRKLKQMIGQLNPGGKIVIGNLSVTNPSRYYMLLFKWIVNHRTEEHLISMAREAGAAEKNISVVKEPLGVNLFLHITA